MRSCPDTDIDPKIILGNICLRMELATVCEFVHFHHTLVIY